MGIRNVLMVISLGISICVGLVLRGRGSPSPGAPQTSGKVSIGLSMDSLKEARWQVDRDVIAARGYACCVLPTVPRSGHRDAHVRRVIFSKV
jgi:hypothetical protein